MIITNLTVQKVDHNDPRYPDADAVKRRDGTHISFSDVYLCQCKTDDGQEFEAPFYVTEFVGDMTPRRTSDMLGMFARAIAAMEKKETKAA